MARWRIPICHRWPAKKEEGMAEQFTSGLSVRLEIRIDAASIPNDSPALGACVRNLEREGWMLDSLCILNDGGMAAVLLRTWRLGVPPRGVATLAATIGTDEKESDKCDT